MKLHPILFSAPMVRALLDCSKTQTRRIVKPQPIQDARFVGGWKVVGKGGEESATCSPLIAEKSPYGQPGDQLWVRETHLNWWNNTEPKTFSHVAAYAADGYELQPGEKWIPSIHMPRAASRITMELTGVRVERLQDISEADAIAEGVRQMCDGSGCWVGREGPAKLVTPWLTARDAYRDLWESINCPGSWDANPWVWCVSFNVKGAK